MLRADFEAPLAELAQRTGAGLMGKTCVERTATNWHHYTRYRRDEALLAHLRAHSVRDDPTRMFGTLGDGFWLSRPALEAYASIGERPVVYGELYVPTILYHLGFGVAEIPARLYGHVRYEPEVSLAEAARAQAGRRLVRAPVQDPRRVRPHSRRARSVSDDSSARRLLQALRHPISQNALAIYVVQFAISVLPLVTLPWIARRLGAGELGVVVFSQSFSWISCC